MAKFLFYDDQLINILAEDERPSGGAAVQAYGWIKGLQHLAQDVEIITLLGPSVKIKEECKSIPLHPIFNLDKGIRWLRWVYYRIPYIYKKFNSIKPDYLYQGIPSWHSFVYVLLCRMLGIKYIQRISNDYLLDDRFYKKHSRLQKYFQNWGIQLSYCVLCQNNYQLKIIHKQ